MQSCLLFSPNLHSFWKPIMSPCNALCFLLLSLVVMASALVVESHSQSSSCHPDQRDTLLRLRNSFSITRPPSIDDYDFCMNTSSPKTASWRQGEDCCSWGSVTCDNSTGDVVGLDLSCAKLRGAINSSSSLFSLRQLRTLSLAGNDLLGSTIPPEISVFTRLTYLNVSQSSITGVVPPEISRLSKLVSLDLSGNSLQMQNPTMRMLLGNLTEIEELDLSSITMYEVIPASLMNFSSSLISLDLSFCSLGGKFPDYIFQLPNLQKLDLTFNYNLGGSLPESNWRDSLSFLSLEYCYFSGEVPHSISNLTRLTHLDLSRNNFTGQVEFRIFSTLKNLHVLGISKLSVSDADANPNFPKMEELLISQGTLRNFPCFLSSMPELRVLFLSGSNVSEFPGQCVNNGPSFPQLQTFYMDNCNLTKFPSFLSRSKKLRHLDLNGNKIEEIPSWFWGVGIDTLEELSLHNNLLKGGFRIPWKRLTDLILDNNLFEGPLRIPPPSLQDFRVSGNRFNGSISPSFCQLTHLLYLDLGQNNLTGVIPQCIGNITGLWYLGLSDNSLTGPLPPSLANCTSMESLDVSYNSISGAPPIWIPTTALSYLDLRANNFVGRWPSDIFLRSTSLQFLDLSTNKFEGLLPLPSYTTTSYSVSNNHFSGEISSLICNATILRLLDLSNNSITGSLPQCLKNITNGLRYFNLRKNEFHGLIPEIFHEAISLNFLDFSRNQFRGSLPRSLSNCEMLEALDVGSNKIVDSFPGWLGRLPLKVLSLRSNKFHGRINIFKRTHLFSKIRILDLSNNSFSGDLPDKFVNEMLGMTEDDNDTARYMGEDSRPYSVMINLKGVEIEMVKINVQFATLDMSSNSFSGEIPRNIGLLRSLKGLNFSYNGFTGTIPPSIGNLTNLESLDLSSNHLVGEIPKTLVQLTSLGALNLSRNNLTGPIPSGGHFNTFLNNSFEENPGLCEIPLTRVCDQGHTKSQLPPDDGEDEAGGWFEWKFVAMGFGSGVVIGISLVYMALETGRPLWLARMVIRLKAGRRKRSKRKASRRNGRR